MTNVWTASFHGRLEEVKDYIKLGFSVDEIQAGYPHDTPLHNAASGGRVETVRYLIREGSDVSLKEDNGNTALHLAARFGHAPVVDVLLNSKSSPGVDAVNSYSLTPRQVSRAMWFLFFLIMQVLIIFSLSV